METIEEIARKHANLKKGFDIAEEEYYNSTGMNAYYSFIEGAKWKEEQDSEEFECIRSFIRSEHLTAKLELYSKDWFNKNKKE